MIQLAPMYTGQSTQNVSDVFVLCGMACVIYFAVNFSISCVVRSIQKKQKSGPSGRASGRAAGKQNALPETKSVSG